MLIGLTANFISLLQIIALQPTILLLASLFSDLIGTIGWVASAPFMMENSKQEERTYLFSFNWAVMIVMSVIGNYIGGVMPDSFNAFLGLPTGLDFGSPFGYRIALAISVGLALVAAFPILLIKEKKVVQRQKMIDFLALRNIRTH